MTHHYNLTICSNRASEAYRLRSDIRAFLKRRGDCTLMGSGISCVDPSYSDLDVRFRSSAIARSSITALRAAYCDRCEIEVN